MSREFDVVIVGGGLAGLSAAVTVARLGHSTALLTGGVLGGELIKIEKIEGVPGHAEGVPGYDLCPITQEQAEEYGVEFADLPATSITAQGGTWLVETDADSYLARSLVIASGTSMAKLDIPGFDRFQGKGVSECASCDAPLLRNKVAIVAGGGDSAMQEALVLADHLDKVIMVVRGDGLSGQAAYRNSIAANPKIEVRPHTEPTEIIGDDSVSHVRVKNTVSGAEEEIETDAIFSFIGLVPNSEIVSQLVDLDDSGRIEVDVAMRTTAKGICAAGNIRQGSPHRAASAMGDAATAAIAIDKFLTLGEWRAT